MGAIDVAKSGRSRCTTCDATIAKGVARVVDHVNELDAPKPVAHYYHLECAITMHPELVHRALRCVDPTIELDRAGVEARIAPRLAYEQEQRTARHAAHVERHDRRRPVVVEPDGATLELYDVLANDPEDGATLGVLADHLQVRGDPRGELIAVQLAIANKVAEDALFKRRDDIMQELSPPLDPADQCVWGIGFVKRLELLARTGSRLHALWDHPSLRVLRELRIAFQATFEANFIPRLAEVAPKSLRVLELSCSYALPGVDTAIAALPRLRTLSLQGRPDLGSLAHPTLERLELRLWSPDDFTVRTELLPAVRELAFELGSQASDFDALCGQLARGWLARIDRLALDGKLGEPGISALEVGLAGRKLARLDLTGTPIPLERCARLASLCDELVMPDAIVDPDRELWVEHTGKPEWGRGTLVRRYEGKVEVKFPKQGVKVFKADAPFLRFG